MVEHQPSKLDTRVRFPSPAPASSRTSYRSRRRFFVPNKRHLSLTPSLLLSKLNPLRWASIWGFPFSRTSYRSRRRFFFQNNRHRSFTSSLLLLQIEPAALGFNLGFSFSRTAYRSRRRFFVPNKRHLSLTSSLLLSKLNPLRWASIWVFLFAQSPLCFDAFLCLRQKKTSSARSLTPPSKSEALWLRICFLLSSGLRIVRDGVFQAIELRPVAVLFFRRGVAA